MVRACEARCTARALKICQRWFPPLHRCSGKPESSVRSGRVFDHHARPFGPLLHLRVSFESIPSFLWTSFGSVVTLTGKWPFKNGNVHEKVIITKHCRTYRIPFGDYTDKSVRAPFPEHKNPLLDIIVLRKYILYRATRTDDDICSSFVRVRLVKSVQLQCVWSEKTKLLLILFVHNGFTELRMSNVVVSYIIIEFGFTIVLSHRTSGLKTSDQQ
jgi:hypothetical protein